jgi:hypothetical protein
MATANMKRGATIASSLAAKRTRSNAGKIDETQQQQLPVSAVVPVGVPENPSNGSSISSSASNVALNPKPKGNKLKFEHYDKPCVTLAKELLGKKLVRKLDSGELLSGHIVETEAYVGVEDKAAHSYGGRETARTKAMFMAPGTAYVYNIYGIYTCINISSQGIK